MSGPSDEYLQLFNQGEPLADYIRTGDAKAALELLRTLLPTQRKSHRELLIRIGEVIQCSHWPVSSYFPIMGKEAEQAQYRAWEMAMVVCGNAGDLLHGPKDLPPISSKDLTDLCAEFDVNEAQWRAALQRETDRSLAEHPRHIKGVQRLVGAGLIKRPTGVDYTIGIIGLPGFMHWQSKGGVRQHFEDDPGLYQAALGLFEVEGTGEYNLAAVDKYAKGQDREWKQIFLSALSEGTYTRSQLLEKTLGTLERDWPQFRAGWFSRFHDALAPDLDEMTALAERYLGLCQSRIAPTVSLALSALKNLCAADRIAGPVLLDALQPVFYSAVKTQVDAALKLADAVVRKSPGLAPAAAMLAIPGLIHEAADLQKKILLRLQSWGVDNDARESLSGHLNSIAAVNYPAVAALLGNPAERVSASLANMDEPAQSEPLDLLDASLALVPLSDTPALIEHIALALENPQAIDEMEQVIEALVRLAPLTDTVRAQCAPLAKRATRLLDKPMTRQLSRLLLFVVNGQRLSSENSGSKGERLLALRIDDLIEQATKGWNLSPMSAPTHRGGTIDSAILAQRISAWRHLGAKPGETEQCLARTRAWPAQQRKRDGYRWSVRTDHFHHAPQNRDYTLRYLDVSTVNGEVFKLNDSDQDAASLRYLVANEPGYLEDFFARGCVALGNNLNWSEAHWENRVYLDLLLQPSTPITVHQPMAQLLLALALAGKEPGQTALAVDILVHASLEGRLGNEALAIQLHDLLASQLVMAKRYSKSLASTVRADSRLAKPIFDLLCEMVMVDPLSPPADLAALLELLLELAITLPCSLPSTTRTAISQLTLGGKGRSVLKNLLALPSGAT